MISWLNWVDAVLKILNLHQVHWERYDLLCLSWDKVKDWKHTIYLVTLNLTINLWQSAHSNNLKNK